MNGIDAKHRLDYIRQTKKTRKFERWRFNEIHTCFKKENLRLSQLKYSVAKMPKKISVMTVLQQKTVQYRACHTIIKINDSLNTNNYRLLDRTSLKLNF